MQGKAFKNISVQTGMKVKKTSLDNKGEFSSNIHSFKKNNVWWFR